LFDNSRVTWETLTKMLLAAAMAGKVSLWNVSGSPKVVATRDLTSPASRLGNSINAMTFSPDGLYLAVMTQFVVQICSLPHLCVVHCIECGDDAYGSWFTEVQFNCIGDRCLTVSRYRVSHCKIRVWAPETGACVGLFCILPRCSARFLANNDILCIFSGQKNFEGSIFNFNTGKCTSLVAPSFGESLCNISLQWGYIEAEHAVIVVVFPYHRSGMVRRWNLHEDVFRWQLELPACTDWELAISPDGSRVAMCGWSNRIYMRVLCAHSGCILHHVHITDFCDAARCRFLPGDHDAIVFSGIKSTEQNKNILTIYNFVTRETTTLETEEHDYEIAVQSPMCTILM
jgi:hypothetical protein